jgi:hypothetical protein
MKQIQSEIAPNLKHDESKILLGDLGTYEQVIEDDEEERNLSNV